jgi:hypothetical protein
LDISILIFDHAHPTTKSMKLVELILSLDYGSSFPDVVRGLVHALEALSSNNSSLPSNFKQKDNLEKQVSVIDACIVTLFVPELI